MNAALLIIGDEILSGDTLDTNSHFASKLLNDNGINVIRRLTVGDRADEITNGLISLLADADLVISCGGLGPTKDDITKKTFADYFQSEMIWNNEVETELIERYQKAGRKLNELTLQQALVPAKAQIMLNPVGTAPIFWFEEKGKVVATLPGVPLEMRYLLQNVLLDKIKARFHTDTIYHETIRTVGITESVIATRVKEIEDEMESSSKDGYYYKLAYLPELAMVKLRLTGTGANETLIKSNIAKWKEGITAEISDFIYGYENDELAAVIGETLRQRKQTLSTAESCAGGYLAHLITSVPGCSDYYMGSIISYSYDIKEKALGVNRETLEKYGAVSEECCREMVAGALKNLETDYAIATTGIAGPGGGTPDKPVGTVWLGVGNKDKIITKHLQFNRNRVENIHLFSVSALDMLRRMLRD